MMMIVSGGMYNMHSFIKQLAYINFCVTSEKNWARAVAYWLWRYATSREVADEVTDCFQFTQSFQPH
jgi:hypothetical protein